VGITAAHPLHQLGRDLFGMGHGCIYRDREVQVLRMDAEEDAQGWARPWQSRAVTAPRVPGAAEFSGRRYPSAAGNRPDRPDGERPEHSLVRRDRRRSRCSPGEHVSSSGW
jgi:hypothetical protein